MKLSTYQVSKEILKEQSLLMLWDELMVNEDYIKHEFQCNERLTGLKELLEERMAILETIKEKPLSKKLALHRLFYKDEKELVKENEYEIADIVREEIEFLEKEFLYQGRAK